MDALTAVRLGQTVLLLAAGVACCFYLASYAQVVDLKNPYARYVVALNVLVITISVSTAVGRLLLPGSTAVEVVRLVLFAVLVVTMGSQLPLLRRSRENDGPPDV